MSDLPLDYLSTVQEIAEFLDIPERRCYELVREENLRIKISEGRVRIPRPRLQEWLEEKQATGTW